MAWSPIREHFRQKRLQRQYDEGRAEKAALRKEQQKQRDGRLREIRRNEKFLNIAEWASWGALAAAVEAASKAPPELMAGTIAVAGLGGFVSAVSDGAFPGPSTYPRQIRMALRRKVGP